MSSIAFRRKVFMAEQHGNRHHYVKDCAEHAAPGAEDVGHLLFVRRFGAIGTAGAEPVGVVHLGSTHSPGNIFPQFDHFRVSLDLLRNSLGETPRTRRKVREK